MLERIASVKYGVSPSAFLRSPLYLFTQNGFISFAPAPARIRLILDPVFIDIDGNSKFDVDIDTIRGLVLKKVEPYEWR